MFRRASCLAALALSAAATAQIPGNYDPSFATVGRTAPHYTKNDNAYSVAIQPDGKILAAGWCHDTDSVTLRPCVTRLNGNGTYDSSFGVSGKLRMTVAILEPSVVRIALQPDGKIVVAATANTGPSFWLARLMADGSSDPSFTGPSGSAPGHFSLPMLPGTGDNYLSALLLQPDGKIVLGGSCTSPAFKMCVVRLTATGAFDPTFDGPGAPGDGRFVIDFPGMAHPHELNALALQSDGRILLAGRFQMTASISDSDFALARLTDTGAFDTTLGAPTGASAYAPGWFALPVGTAFDEARAVLLQPDDRIVIAGMCVGVNNDFCVARLNADGSLDVTFDGPSGSANGKFLLPIGTNNDNLRLLLQQPDGKLILGGSCAVGAVLEFCLARLNHDGSLDSTFDGPGTPGNGLFTFNPYSSNSFLYTGALQPDGQLVLAGTCFRTPDDDQCIVRLHGGPAAARACTLDVDGDGVVSATRDTLILTRVALGLTGSAVVNGISFAPHATRTSWSAIRSWLVSQCGMSLP